MILITGANGFIGRNLVISLKKRNFKLRLLVRSNLEVEKELSIDDEVIKINDLYDLTSNQIMKLLEGIDVVIHTAWYSGKDIYNSLNNLKSLDWTLKFAECILESQVKKFVGLGTCSEYQFSENVLKTDSKVNPKNLYASTKLSCYFILKEMFESKLNFLWCRLFYVYGEGDKSYKLTQYIREKVNNNQKAYLTHGNQIRDFIHVQLAASMITKYAMSNKIGIVNICSGEPKSIKKFALELVEEEGKTDLLSFGLRNENKFDPPFILGQPPND